MLTHVKVLSVIFIAFSALGILSALLVLFGFGVAITGVGVSAEPDALAVIPFLAMLGTGLFVAVLLISIPGLLAGIGMLKLQPWARITAIIVCALILIAFPLGTVVGGYGLWVMLSGETERLFNPTTAVRT